jgi:tripartite-type tricarboxylate transporter receptor subunit TctC
MMNIARREFLSLASASVVGLASSPPVWAQTYPTRPVRVIVPFAAGGIDVIARFIAQRLSKQLGQEFVVENIGGAGGSIGTTRAAKAAPDGYSLLFTAPAFVIYPALRDNVPYDPLTNFAAITSPATTSLVLLINPSMPAHSIKDFIALIKAQSGKHSFASAGIGTPPHLTGELFRQSLGLDLVHVPYDSGGQAIGAVVGGHTSMCFAAVAPAVAQVKAGKLRALAVTSKSRLQALPDVPTMTEAGYPDIEGEVWCAMLAPTRTPKEIIALLHREVVKIVTQPDVRKRLAALGYSAVANTPVEFGAYLSAERARWAKVIQAAGLKAHATPR